MPPSTGISPIVQLVKTCYILPMRHDTSISLPPELAEKFIKSCQAMESDGERVLQSLVEEFLAEREAAEMAQVRRADAEGFVSLEEVMARHDLEH